ncbi:MAG: hypothetical protein Q9191_003098, partial [Dirinaria sp. TL-2023a]
MNSFFCGESLAATQHSAQYSEQQPVLSEDEMQSVTEQLDVDQEEVDSSHHPSESVDNPHSIYPEEFLDYYVKARSFEYVQAGSDEHMQTCTESSQAGSLRSFEVHHAQQAHHYPMYNNVAPMEGFSYNNHCRAEPDSSSQVPAMTQTPSQGVYGEAGGSSWELAHEYDPLWMQKKGIGSEAYSDFETKLKFDTLFVHGAFKVGDTLTISAYYQDQGINTETEARFQFTGMERIKHPTSRPAYLLPSFAATFPDLRTLNGTLDACNGVKQIAAFLNTRGLAVGSGLMARQLNVYRGSQHLGTYDHFKHAYHLWIERQDAEAKRQG